MSSLSSLDRFTMYAQSVRLLRWCKRADTCRIFWPLLAAARPISSEALSSAVLWLLIQTIIYTI